MTLKPRLFLGSSSEAKENIALPIIQRLAEIFDIHPWWDIFPTGKFTLEVLLEQVKKTDLAILIFDADDETTSRGKTSPSTRDNVILEYGLFVAELGRSNVEIIADNSVKLPSDIYGLGVFYLQEDEAGKQADLSLACKKIQKKHNDLRRRGSVNDGGAGFSKTLTNQFERLEKSIHEINEGRLPQDFVLFESRNSCLELYNEGLTIVESRFCSTTFVDSDFWIHGQTGSQRIIAENARMLKRLKDNHENGKARRLFLLDRPLGKKVEFEREKRIHLRRQGRDQEYKNANMNFRNLKRNVADLSAIEGMEIGVVYDGKGVHNAIVENNNFSPLVDEIAIYDDQRIDIYSSGKNGQIVSASCYSQATCADMKLLVGQFQKYFDDLWKISTPIGEFLDEMDRALDMAEARIDFDSNFLWKYERDLNDEDRILKEEEISAVREFLKTEGVFGKVRRFMDIGTCTARYPRLLRDAVVDEGDIVGIDDDKDCIEMSRFLVKTEADEDSRIKFVRQSFLDPRLQEISGEFDLITCMLGTLSHFGLNRMSDFDDYLQRALSRACQYLHKDGIAFFGTWSKEAKEDMRFLDIYHNRDKEKLQNWTADPHEYEERLRKAGFELILKKHVNERLDLWCCRRPKS